MGEREQNRQSVETMASALYRHAEAKGKPISADAARKQAAESARVSDAKKEAGALRNKRKRSPKEAPESRKASGKTFVDYGSKKG